MIEAALIARMLVVNPAVFNFRERRQLQPPQQSTTNVIAALRKEFSAAHPILPTPMLQTFAALAKARFVMFVEALGYAIPTSLRSKLPWSAVAAPQASALMGNSGDAWHRSCAPAAPPI
jgi:hypothetical protein